MKNSYLTSFFTNFKIKTVLAFALLLLSVGSWGQTVVATKTTAGTSTIAIPAGVANASVEATGAGGGGGSTGSVAWSRGGGGAGGSYIKHLLSVTNTTYNYTVGAGGVAATQGGSSYFGNTTAGSSTGSTVLAIGGAGGATNTVAGTSNTVWGSGAGGGASSTGNIPASGYAAIFAGTSGTTSSASGAGATGGAGGAGAGSAGIAGGGAGAVAVAYSTPGGTGTAPGGGGSGGCNGNSTTNRVGGAGGVGKVVITYYTVPVLTSLSSSTAVAGSTVTLTVTGTGTTYFTGVSTITWNGVAIPTTFVSATSLTAVITSNITVAGTFVVGVRNTGTFGTSNSVATSNFVVTSAGPSITGAAMATAFTTTYGTASTAQTFAVSGSGLTNDLVATAPLGFEVSADGTTYGTTATFAQVAGSASGSLRIRLAATAAVGGTYNSQNIVLSSSPLTSVNITTAASGNTVTAKALTITAQNQSVLFGTVAATVTGAGTYIATGFVNSETSAIIVGSATYTTTYTAITAAGTAGVTITPVVTGLTATNYSFTATNGTITITSTVKKILWDGLHAETEASADWSIDADGYTTGWNAAGACTTGVEGTPQQYPTPAQSGITAGTAENYWTGGNSAWAVALVKAGYAVESLSPCTGAITYGNGANPQDLSNYAVFVVNEPNTVFSATEKTAILNFVNAGGGLFMVADHGCTTLCGTEPEADRNGDGFNSTEVWNDLMTADPFGIQYNNNQVTGVTSTFVSVTDPIIVGTGGTVTVTSYNQGSSMSTNTLKNASAIGVVYDSGTALPNATAVRLARASYGNGRVIALGDSSPTDDGTGDTGDTLFNNWGDNNNTQLVLNATYWLAEGSPQFYVTPSYLTGFTYAETSGPSANQTFSLVGNKLTGSGNVTVTGNTEYEVSTDGTTFANAITYPYAAGIITGQPKTVYVRLKAGLTNAASPYNTKLIAITGGSADPINVTCDGTVTPPTGPTITKTGILTAVSTTYGTASASPTTFSVSGSNMTAGILVTPPAGYEVCLAIGGTYTSTVTVGAAGTIASTPVYVRLMATATVAAYSGNIVLTSASATTVNVATVSSTVSAKALTITGLTGVNKNYDATTSATATGTAAYAGFVNGDSFAVVTGTPTYTFASATAGTGITINTTGYTAPSSNYTVTQPTLSADITAVAPGAPTSVTAVAGNGQATVTFTAPTFTGGSVITGYTVTSSSGGFTASGATSPIIVTGLTNGTAYSFTVTATNAIGTGVASTASNSVTPFAAPANDLCSGATTLVLDAVPVSGTFVNATVSAALSQDATKKDVWYSITPTCTGTHVVTTSWTAGPDLDVRFYTTSCPASGAASFSAATTSNPEVYTGSLVSGTTYYVRVIDFTGSATTFTIGVTAPIQATAVVTSAAASSVLATTATLNGNVTTLGVCPATTSKGFVFSATATNADPLNGGTGVTTTSVAGLATGAYTLNKTGLTSNTSYTFKAYVFDGTAYTYGVAQTFTTATVPGAPTAVSAVAGNTQATISFTAPASDGGAAITSYTVTSAPGGFTGSGATSPITVTGLTNGTAYTFTVTATNIAGTGPASTASNSVTPTAVAPSAPTITTIAPSSGQLSVAFTAGANGGSAITNYEYSTDGGATFTACSPTQTTSPIIITGLTNGISYNVQIRAVNAIGSGTPTASTAATPAAISTIYFNDFGTTTTPKPYTAVTTIDPNLNTSSWTNNTVAFTGLVGNGGSPSMSLSNATAGTFTYTLTFNVAANYGLSVTSFDFWGNRSGTGSTGWSMTINGTAVGSGSFPTAASIGQTNVSNAISGLSGTITVVVTMTGATGTGSTRLDDFTLYGSVLPTLPLLTTPTATSITTTGATLGATITNTGGSAITSRGTVWGTAAAPTTNGAVEGGTAISAFTHTRTGFTANTVYKYRGYAVNTSGTGYSPDGTFTTLHNAPTVGAGSGATASSIVANWTAPTGGGAAAYTYEIQVDDDPAFGSVNYTTSGISSGTLAATATGLASSTVFYYRVRVNNAGGSSAWSSTSVGYATIAPVATVNLSTTTLTGFTYILGAGPSATQSFTVNGTTLSTDIVLTAPTNYEISTAAGSGFGNTITLAQTAGTVASTTIYVRLKASLVAGNYNSENIAIASTSVTTQYVACSGTVTACDINLKGNTVSIVSGNTATTTGNHTAFGSANLTGGTVVRTYTIENLGNAPLSLTGVSPYITISGTNAADFTVTAIPSASIAAGGSTTFSVTFDPSVLGSRTATISIANNDSNENPYTFNIQGDCILGPIFFETMGATPVGGTTQISAHETAGNFAYVAGFMSSGVAANAADIRTSGASSGYTGASGGNYIWFTNTNTSGNYGFSIANIDTSAYTTLDLSFAVGKVNGSGSSFGTLALDYSPDNGATWVNVPISSLLPLSTAGIGWSNIQNIALPIGACGLTNLTIRWVKSGIIAIRLDDILLTGTNCALTLGNITPSSGPVGTRVTINATSGDLSTATASFNGTAATVISTSPTKMVVDIAAGSTSGNLIVNDGTCQTATPYTIIDTVNSSCQYAPLTELIITEVLDDYTNNPGGFEIYNPTASAIDLTAGNYTFVKIPDDSATETTHTLTGTLAAGAIYLIDATSGDNECGTVANGFLGSGFNGLDKFELRKGGVVIDKVVAPNEVGYSILRKTTNLVPSAIYNAADWTTYSQESCADYGSFIPLGLTPTITVQPVLTENCSSAIINGLVATEGLSGSNALAYQWYEVAPDTALWSAIADGGIYGGATTTTLSIASTVGKTDYQYYCQVRENTATCYTASNPVILTGSATAGLTWTSGGWSPATPAPSVTTTIIIDADYNTSTNGSFSACSVIINSGKKLEITAAHYVNIQNNLTVSAGATLTVLDQGSLVMISDSGIVTNNGTTTIHRFTTPFEKYDYTYWSTPVENASIANTFLGWKTNYTYEFHPENFIDITDKTGNGAPDGFDDNGNDWLRPSPMTMSAGKGYIVMVPNPTAGPVGNTSEAVFSGKVNNGLIEPTIAFTPANGIPATDDTDDWNLVGNPYPSAISADSFITTNAIDTNNISGTLYFWTHKANIGGGFNLGPDLYNFAQSDYAIYNLSGGAATTSATGSANASVNSVPLGKIASGQGFFVEADNSTLVFKNAMRDKAYANDQFFRKRPKIKDRVWLNLENEMGMFSQQLVAYIPNTTLGYDKAYDGLLNDGGNYINFYSFIDKDTYKIQSRSSFDRNDQVRLGYFSALAGTFNINIDAKEGVFAKATDIFLEDKLLNVIHDLKTAPYSFTTGKGTFNDRFVLRYVSNTNDALGTNDLKTIEKQVLVSNKDKQVKVTSLVEPIAKVAIYDLLGRLIYQKEKVNNTELVIANLAVSEQTLVVKVSLQNGSIVTKKIIY